ncbi:TRAP transporter small permease [Arenibaculum pallidiluteum]|uniref:TRAP transporter small permease n=1 Tax=Arenibaculum pallidiluteum TaxID=2812559 RepID=UPI001A957FA2|nr:TRAP transporter small permease subunit [Arenibaculum pallidiluteum]
MKAFYDFLGKVEAVLAGTFLILMVLLIVAGGVSRMTADPINWTGDFATCLFAWACFFCADVAWRRDALMSVDLVVERLPVSVQKLFVYLNYVLISLFLIFLIGAGSWLSYISRARTFQGIPEISYSWVTMSLPVGAALLLVTTLVKMRHAALGHAQVQQPAL